MTVRVHPSKAQLAAFFEHVTVSDGCWIWTGPVTDKGLPKFGDCPAGQATGTTRPARLPPRVPMAHRTAWAWFRGRLLAYPYCKVEQVCNVARCVNPAHLRQVRVPQPGELLISTARLAAVFAGIVVTPAGCWRWTGPLNASDYPISTFDDGTTRAVDQLLFTWFAGYPEGKGPQELQLWHHCGSRPCVNPAHMRLVPHGHRWTIERLAHGTPVVGAPTGSPVSPPSTKKD